MDQHHFRYEDWLGQDNDSLFAVVAPHGKLSSDQINLSLQPPCPNFASDLYPIPRCPEILIHPPRRDSPSFGDASLCTSLCSDESTLTSGTTITDSDFEVRHRGSKSVSSPPTPKRTRRRRYGSSISSTNNASAEELHTAHSSESAHSTVNSNHELSHESNTTFKLDWYWSAEFELATMEPLWTNAVYAFDGIPATDLNTLTDRTVMQCGETINARSGEISQKIRQRLSSIESYLDSTAKLLGLPKDVGYWELDSTLGNQKSRAPKMEPGLEATLNEALDYDGSTDSHWDESASVWENDSQISLENDNLEAEVMAILGAEYAHLAVPLLTSWNKQEVFTQGTNGVESGSTTASGSSGSQTSTSTTGQTSGTETSLSNQSSSGKGKGAINGFEKNQGNDEDDEERPPKRQKIAKFPENPVSKSAKYSCILFKIDPVKHIECGTTSFAFRHLWQHLERSHLACHNCGEKLIYSDALKHLTSAQQNPTGCVRELLDKTDGTDFIGIPTYIKLSDIYREKIPDSEKWRKWSNVLSPGRILDPTHDELITIPTSKIPTTLESIRTLWDAEEASGNFTAMDKDEQNERLKLVGKAIRLGAILRRKSRQSKRPAISTSSDVGNSTPINLTMTNLPMTNLPTWAPDITTFNINEPPWNTADLTMYSKTYFVNLGNSLEGTGIAPNQTLLNNGDTSESSGNFTMGQHPEIGNDIVQDLVSPLHSPGVVDLA